MAVRLDPFRRIVGVGWPSAATGPFRVLLQIDILAGPIYRYQLAMHFHGDQSAVYFGTDQARGTWGGTPFTNPNAPAVFYSAAGTFPGFGLHPDVVTPTGWTVFNAALAVAGYFLDAQLTLFEILRAGSPILAVDVSTWSTFANQSGGYPAAGTFANRVRVK